MQQERRRHFLINKPLQFRYMLTIVLTLSVVTSVSLVGLYFGIWGHVINAFSDDQIQNDLLTASRMEQYEEARRPTRLMEEPFSSLSLFRQAERLSDRQREIFKEILRASNKGLIGKLIFLLILLAWGTVFLSHKMAGPLFRFERILEDLSGRDLTVRCQLRKFDEAKSVAQAFNRALETLEQDVAQLKNLLSENENPPDRLVENLREGLSKYKTRS